MDDFSVYVIDFEGSLQTGILEYGIVEVSSTNGILGADTQLCKNKTNISHLEQECHHLKSDNLSHCSYFEDHLELFIKARQNAFFCAHNAAFENTLLSAYAPILTTHHQSHTWEPWIDTYFLYKKYLKISSCGLNDLIKIFDLGEVLEKISGKFCPPTRKNFHCALYDALACALLFLNFIRLPEIQSKSLTWLLQMSSPLKTAQELQQQQLF